MISSKVLSSLQFDKILGKVADFAVLSCTKTDLLCTKPSSNLNEVEYLLNFTDEAYNLIYNYGFNGVEFFDNVKEELELSQRGASLSMGQLLKVATLLRSARLVKNFVFSVNDDKVIIFKDKIDCVFIDHLLEKEIFSKIISDEQMADMRGLTVNKTY